MFFDGTKYLVQYLESISLTLKLIGYGIAQCKTGVMLIIETGKIPDELVVCQADGVVLFWLFGKKNRLMKLLNKIFEILSGGVFPVLISCTVSIVPIQIKGI